jgi:hypothetical protein
MAYNNGFPVTYPQMFPQYQQPYQMPQYQQMQQPAQQQIQQPSSRMAEVFPAASEKAVLEFPVSAGTTQMFIANDDSFIAIKEASVTGQITTHFYDKRPPAPPERPVDMAAYVTWDKLEERLAALSAPIKRTAKKETEVEA